MDKPISSEEYIRQIMPTPSLPHGAATPDSGPIPGMDEQQEPDLRGGYGQDER